MAIKKSEVGKLSEDDRQFVEAAERYIDAKLNRRHRGLHRSTSVTIYFDELHRAVYNKSGELNHLVQAKLKLMYEDAGWSVATESDQKEGAWFRFS